MPTLNPHNGIELATVPHGYRITDLTTGTIIVELPISMPPGAQFFAALAENYYAALVALYADVTDPLERLTLDRLILAPTGPGNAIDVADFNRTALAGLARAGKITLNQENRTAYLTTAEPS